MYAKEGWLLLYYNNLILKQHLLELPTACCICWPILRIKGQMGLTTQSGDRHLPSSSLPNHRYNPEDSLESRALVAGVIRALGRQRRLSVREGIDRVLRRGIVRGCTRAIGHCVAIHSCNLAPEATAFISGYAAWKGPHNCCKVH
jgi:hypothetical protein